MSIRTPLAILGTLALLSAGCSSTRYSDYDYDPYYSGMGYRSGFFYDDLAPYGTWYERSPYGWVWSPTSVTTGWRPYTVGYWAYTDFGWTWVSDDPWGWAPYHYGRWDYDDGWFWVPGDTWAPAWVSWRYGDGWAGWAPLPPDVRWRGSAGLEYSGSELDRRIRPTAWSFVPEEDLESGSIRGSVLPTSRNQQLLQRTRNVTRYGSLGNRPAERGLDPTLIERATGQPVRRRAVVDRPSPVTNQGHVADQSIDVYRPQVIPRRSEVRPSSPQGSAQTAEADRRHAEAERRLERQREEADRRTTETRLRGDRQRLEQRQREELRHPPSGVSRDELRRRHQQEMDEQRAIEAQERQKLQERHRETREARDREQAR
jgi:uncharacterized protein DUF6600